MDLGSSGTHGTSLSGAKNLKTWPKLKLEINTVCT